MSMEFQAGAGLRDVLQVLQDESVEGLGAPGGELPMEDSIEVSYPDTAVDQQAAVVGAVKS
jgi:hypothetical protein